MGAARDTDASDYESDLLSGSSGGDVALFKAMTVLKRHLRLGLGLGLGLRFGFGLGLGLGLGLGVGLGLG